MFNDQKVPGLSPRTASEPCDSPSFLQPRYKHIMYWQCLDRFRCHFQSLTFCRSYPIEYWKPKDLGRQRWWPVSTESQTFGVLPSQTGRPQRWHTDSLYLVPWRPGRYYPSTQLKSLQKRCSLQKQEFLGGRVEIKGSVLTPKSLRPQLWCTKLTLNLPAC